MAADPVIDPVALLRNVLSGWSAAFAPPPPATTDAETAGDRLMAQALAAANMPSRGEIGDLAARMDRMEESLARIERKLEAVAGLSGSGKHARATGSKRRKDK